MPETTPTYKLPFPAPSDEDDVPESLRNLATAVEEIFADKQVGIDVLIDKISAVEQQVEEARQQIADTRARAEGVLAAARQEAQSTVVVSDDQTVQELEKLSAAVGAAMLANQQAIESLATRVQEMSEQVEFARREAINAQARIDSAVTEATALKIARTENLAAEGIEPYGATGNYNLPYPNLADIDNVPLDMKELAEATDVVLFVKQDKSEKGTMNGYASLDAGGKVPPAQLPASMGMSTYTHTQSVLAAMWVITHNLSRYPSVTVVDTGDSVVIPSVHYDSADQVTLVFGSPTSGKAYLN